MATLAYSDILEPYNWTIGDITAIRTENRIDDAIDWINLECGLSIENMTGTAGSKTATVSTFERPVVKLLAMLYCAAYITSGSAIGLNIRIGGLNTDKVVDFPLQELKEKVAKGLRLLAAHDEIPFYAYNEPIETT